MPYLHQLEQKQALPLESKVRLAQMRIKAWYQYWDWEGVAVFDDRTPAAQVLVDLVRELEPDVQVVSYENDNGLFPVHLVVPSMVRKDFKSIEDWLKYGCNSYLSSPPRCRPLSVWLDEDVYLYLEGARDRILRSTS